MIITINDRQFDVQPYTRFELHSDDVEGLVTALKGVLTPDVESGLNPYPDSNEVFLKVYSDRDEAIFRTAASDAIRHEWSYLSDERPNDDNTGLVAYRHHLTRPAERRLDSNGNVMFEHWCLWDVQMREEDHADAIKAGVANDLALFKPWWAKRLAMLKRKGFV